MAKKAAKKELTGGMTKGQKIGLGVGLGATALAAVGGYFFYGSPNASKHRKKAKSWMLKAKAEVLEGLENAKHMTKAEYEALIADVVRGYKRVQGTTTGELNEFAKEMRAHWRDIERSGKTQAKKTAKRVVKRAKKVAKKATR